MNKNILKTQRGEINMQKVQASGTKNDVKD